MRTALAPYALALLAVPAAASDLTLDGATDVQVPYGGAFQVALSGGPGLPAFVFFDGSPGPTVLAGESIPLGFTPQLGLLVSGTTDGAGLFQSPFFLAEDPTHAGLVIYMAGAILDGGDPNGIDVSNGASLTIVPKAGAGENQTTLVGRPTALDGSGATLADGTLAAGTSVLWQVVSRPPGSVAQLVDGGELFPSIAPDVVGDYTLQITVSKGGVDNVAQTTVHAYDVQLAPALDGQYVVTPSASVQGSISGPSGVTAQLNGTPLALGAGGSFGPILQTMAPGEIFLPLLFELQHPDGSGTRERYSVAQGPAAALDLPVGQGARGAAQPRRLQPDRGRRGDGVGRGRHRGPVAGPGGGAGGL